jgi:hypothetical protein
MSLGQPRRVLFSSATIQNIGGDRCAVHVEVRGSRTTYRGSAEGGCEEQEQLRCAAQATITALRDLGHRVELDTVEALNILGEWTVALRVLAEHEGVRRKLVGFCVAGNDVLQATVFALLNATNRFLDIG